MPHVLGTLQGWQVKEEAKEGEGHEEGSGLKLAEPGTLSPEEYRSFVGDLVNFMTYAAEPSSTERVHTGGRVMIYLLVLLVLTYLLKKEFWRDVH
jgi:ubiquinol-cytochrome c reductase cytochrome c1 subunit